MTEKYKGNARDAHLHMEFIFVALDTSHAEMSSLKSLKYLNTSRKLVTLDTSLTKKAGQKLCKNMNKLARLFDPPVSYTTH